MELSSLRLENFLYFPAPASKFFLNNFFFPNTTYSEKVSYIFSKKAFLIFRKRNFSYILAKIYSEPWHKETLLYFWKWSLLAVYFSCIWGSNFPRSKKEKKQKKQNKNKKQKQKTTKNTLKKFLILGGDGTF